jgi:endonuclease/exonuclease/phosphatase family metal-dependent hydrolase
MQRCAIEATIQCEFGALRVVTTHLEYYSVLQRRAQVERLRELDTEAMRHAAQPRPGQTGDGPFDSVVRAASAVMVGDFNCGPNSDEIAALLRPLDTGMQRWCDGWVLANPGRAHEPTLGLHDKQQWPGPPLTFDFAFVTADLASRVRRVAVEPSSDASDHQPLLIELS